MISTFDKGQILKIVTPYKPIYSMFFMTKLILQFVFLFSNLKNKLFQSIRVTTTTSIKNSQKGLLLEIQSLNTDIVTWTSLHFVFQQSLIL